MANRYFFHKGVSISPLYWLLFRQSLHSEDWVERARSLTTEEKGASTDTIGDNKLLSLWLEAQPGIDTINASNHWLVASIGALFGLLAMTGSMTYSGNAPVNLWLLLGLFTFAPLLMTLLTFIRWRTVIQHPSRSIGITLALLFRPLLRQFNIQQNATFNQLQTRTLQPWLLWQMQWMALAFQLTAIVTFLLIVVFQDVAFGWSSTVVESTRWMTPLLQGMAWPWHSLIDPPSADLIAQSQFYRGDQTFDAMMLGQWWSTIVMAMLVYGLLPRLLLTVWMRRQVKQLVLTEISASGEVERFIRAVRRTEISDKQTDNDQPDIAISNSLQQLQGDDSLLLAWQQNIEGIDFDKVLGIARWQDDEDWIKQHAASWSRPVRIIVRQQQTPTAELVDLLQLALSINSSLVLEIALLTSDDTDHPSRQQGQVKSWQHFAQQNKLALTLLRADSRTDDKMDNQST